MSFFYGEGGLSLEKEKKRQYSSSRKEEVADKNQGSLICVDLLGRENVSFDCLNVGVIVIDTQKIGKIKTQRITSRKQL